MKGLLIKDLYFTLRQKQLFLIILFMFGVFYISQGAESAPFVISYTSLMGGMFVLTSISYDDFENSISYLLTLPITRKEYVQEKYVFGILGVWCFWAVPTIAYSLLKLETVLEIVMIALTILAVITAFELLIIPIQLKFGGDKGRIALLGVIVAGMLLLYGIKGIGEYLMEKNAATKILFENIISGITNCNPWLIGMGIILLLVFEAFISYRISLNVMEKREY